VRFGHFREWVDLRSWESLVLEFHRFHDSTLSNGTRKEWKTTCREVLRQVFEVHIKADIWLIWTIGIDRFFMSESFERFIIVQRNYLFFSNWFDEIFRERLSDSKYIFLFDEAHLAIDLVELTWVTIRAWIFISETWSNLEVLIHTTYHEELLVLLWCLRESIEFAMMEARWNEVVSSSFWRWDA
jgi:hypothetical protein